MARAAGKKQPRYEASTGSWFSGAKRFSTLDAAKKMPGAEKIRNVVTNEQWRWYAGKWQKTQ
jgi:hypothetical protein